MSSLVDAFRVRHPTRAYRESELALSLKLWYVKCEPPDPHVAYDERSETKHLEWSVFFQGRTSIHVAYTVAQMPEILYRWQKFKTYMLPNINFHI